MHKMRIFYFVLLCFLVFKTGASQESLVFDAFIFDYSTFSYDKSTNEIYYKDLLDGKIYFAKINSSTRNFFLGDSFISAPAFFKNNHQAAILKYNDTPHMELFYYDFPDSSLTFKANLPSSAYNLRISPNDEKILYNNNEPNYYSVLNDSLIDVFPKLNTSDISWDSDSSFFFIKDNKYILKYIYSSSEVDTVLEASGYDYFSSIFFDRTKSILAYGYNLDDSDNAQLILYDLENATKKIVFDLKKDFPSAYGMAISIEEIKLSPLSDKIAFILHYWTISAGDLIIYDYAKDKSFLCTEYNYGVKRNLMWINQDTVLYHKEFQLYSFDLKNCLPIFQEAYPTSSDLQISNYPNPFNSFTLIEVNGKYLNQIVSLKIFDIQGKKVRFLNLPHIISPNKIKFSWDGRNDNGTIVASGVYIVVVSGFKAYYSFSNICHKVILIK